MGADDTQMTLVRCGSSALAGSRWEAGSRQGSGASGSPPGRPSHVAWPRTNRFYRPVCR